jgi:RoxA-like, cytochrome c-like
VVIGISLVVGVCTALVGIADRPTADDSSQGDATRGREALLKAGYLSPAWTFEAFAKVGMTWKADHPDPKSDPDGYREAFQARYGLHESTIPNDGLPMGLRRAVAKQSGRLGLQVDCLLCHGGSIGGQSYIGLGNSQLDIEPLFRDLTIADGYRPPPVAFVVNTARGTVNAGQMSAVLLAMRNHDLSKRVFPLPLGSRFSEIDTPAWWHLKKKQTMYYDGRTDSRSVRSLMQFMLGELERDEFVKLEPTFRDIRAYLLTLSPPKYPFSIDGDLASQGKRVFERDCARCHGTYGEQPSYPNKVVELDVIGTDPARAKAPSALLVAHYNKSWFGEFYPADEKMTGYQAPPLDGVWATAPYLHNGSVPTLANLLDSETRPHRFLRPPSTSFDHYDQVKVGWKAEEMDEAPDHDSQELRRYFDSSRFGLNNAGHTFGDHLDDPERRALIEYLKTL